jgi:hypothetical protein
MSRGNPYSGDSFPAHELVVRCLGAMTNGSFTPLAQMAGREATHATLREIGKRKRWFVRLEQEPWAALLVSEQTRQFYAYGNVMERWLSHALGVFRVAMEEHFPLTLVTEQDLTPESLQRFRVLVLPNAACLSDEQAETVRRYVLGGGGLVATCETSLCDELGRPRSDFALADLFGTSYLGRPESPALRSDIDANFALAIDDAYWARRAGAGAFRFGDFPDSVFATDARLRHLLPNGQATFKGPLVRTTGFALPMRPAALFFPEGSREPFPVAAIGEHGAGRVAYFAAGIDAANFSYAWPWQRVVLAQALRWAAREPCPVEIRAPMCVQSTFWRQRDGENQRLVIHLWNGLNTTSDHGAQDVEVPLREESVPVHGIEVEVRGLAFTRAHCEPEGVELAVETVDGVVTLSVPPLAIHSAVVLEAVTP